MDISSALSGVNLSAIMPSSTELLNNIALGAATSVVLAGVKSKAGQQALDPLGLFPHPAEGAPAAPPNVNNPAAIVGPTITASAFAQLPPGVAAQLTAAGVHIVAG